MPKVLSLDQIMLGRRYQVSGLTAAGMLRRRLLDLGIVSGAIIIGVRRASFGDPTAYLIKGALVALRKEEACLIQVAPADSSP